MSVLVRVDATPYTAVAACTACAWRTLQDSKDAAQREAYRHVIAVHPDRRSSAQRVMARRYGYR